MKNVEQRTDKELLEIAIKSFPSWYEKHNEGLCIFISHLMRLEKINLREYERLHTLLRASKKYAIRVRKDEAYWWVLGREGFMPRLHHLEMMLVGAE